MLHSFIVHIKV